MAPDYKDESVLLDALKKRSESAYEFIYNTSAIRLTILAASILNDENAAKDLMHDFFTDFWDKRLADHINVSLKAYLFYTVRNRAFKTKKANQLYHQFVEDLAVHKQTDIPQYFENEELRTAIEMAIAQLSPMANKTFTMHYINNLSHEDIAAKLGLSKQTVGNHIHRALTELRNKLKKTL